MQGNSQSLLGNRKLSPASASSREPLSWVQRWGDTALLQRGSAWGCLPPNQSRWISLTKSKWG